MTSILSHVQIDGRWHDVNATAAAFFAAITTRGLSEWLQVVVMALTIVFLCLGIFLRWQKIRAGEIPEVDEEDEPTGKKPEDR